MTEILDVDLLAFESSTGERRRAVVDGVTRSLATGFVYTRHDLSEDLLDTAYAMLREFFALDTEVLAASIRHPRHVTEAAMIGSHIATLPFKVLQQMVRHPLTDKGIVAFQTDWKKAREAAAAKG